MSDERNLYSEIFFSNSSEARRLAIEAGGRFSYYTNAETASLILKNQELWMRNTSVMNDYMEVEHGLNCLLDAYNSELGFQFKTAIDNCFPDVSNELESLFNSWIPTIKKHTYIISVSQHTKLDDTYGRLSMWRAYGGNAGVAFVFNGGPMFRPSDALNAYSSPVAYLEPSEVAEELRKITSRINQNQVYIRNLGKERLIAAMFEVFRFASICTKHPAFLEEREWRVVSTQELHKSERLKPTCEVIGGVPQLLLKLKLKDYPEENLWGLSIPTFLDRILIGPCEHPETIKAALAALLAECGVENPESKIYITGIPLRPNQR